MSIQRVSHIHGNRAGIHFIQSDSSEMDNCDIQMVRNVRLVVENHKPRRRKNQGSVRCVCYQIRSRDFELVCAVNRVEPSTKKMGLPDPKN